MGYHTEWFPTINLNDIAAIIVSTTEAKIAGVTISGTTGNKSLLFTAAADAATFTDGTFGSSVTIKDYFPFSDNTGNYTATNDAEIFYGQSGDGFYIYVRKGGFVTRQWNFIFDNGGGLRYQTNYYPMGYTFTNDPFTIVPAQVDLNRLYTFNESWSNVYYYNSNSSGTTTIETLVQGPYYVVVPAGAFKDVIKLTIRQETPFSGGSFGSSLVHDTVKFWLDKQFGIVKMSINDFEFEVAG